MKLIFKQAVKIEGKIYTRGSHELFESELNKIVLNKTYIQFCKLGLIIEEPVHMVLSTESLESKNLKLAEKFAPKKLEEKPAEEAAPKKKKSK